MMNKLFLSALIVSTIFFTSCGGSSDVVKIGTQKWAAKNLDVATFRNGDPIYEAKTEAEWKAAGEAEKPACCFWQMNAANGVKFGRLYNYFAVKDPRGLAPQGWHIPSKEEWKTLKAELEQNYKDGTVSSQMRSTSGWRNEANGNNKSGFNALPSEGVGRMGESDAYSRGNWWMSGQSWVAGVGYDSKGLFLAGTFEGEGNSIRCVKD
jgi:uncharacterized protein (TIGR02145 family)